MSSLVVFCASAASGKGEKEEEEEEEGGEKEQTELQTWRKRGSSNFSGWPGFGCIRLLGQPLGDRMGETKFSRWFCYSLRNNFEAFEAFRKKH